MALALTLEKKYLANENIVLLRYFLSLNVQQYL